MHLNTQDHLTVTKTYQTVRTLSAAWVKFFFPLVNVGKHSNKNTFVLKQFMFKAVKWFIDITQINSFISQFKTAI